MTSYINMCREVLKMRDPFKSSKTEIILDTKKGGRNSQLQPPPSHHGFNGAENCSLMGSNGGLIRILWWFNLAAPKSTAC